MEDISIVYKFVNYILYIIVRLVNDLIEVCEWGEGDMVKLLFVVIWVFLFWDFLYYNELGKVLFSFN